MSEEQGGKQNSAARLHAILVGLKERHSRKPGVKQKEALLDVLEVAHVADMHERLGELQRLPSLARDELIRAGAAKSFLRWVGPIEQTLNKLSGSAQEDLGSLVSGRIDTEILYLEMCRDHMKSRETWEDSFEMEDLDKALAAVESAIKEVKRADVDAELAAWLKDNLQAMRDVLTTARVLGMKAARKRMYELACRMGFESHPEPKTAAEKDLVVKLKALLLRVVEIVPKVAKMIDATETFRRLTE